MYKGLCVINMKGGVGKTTVAVNVAWRASQRGYRSLVVDLDPQFNSSVYLMGERPYVAHIQSGGLTIFDIFEQFSPMRDPQRPRPDASNTIYTRVRQPWGARAALHVIPSQLEFAATLKNPSGKAHLLATFLSKEATDYDLVVIDPPPTDSMATEAAYLASNYVLVPVKPEFLSSIGFPLLDRSVSNFRQQYPTHPLDMVGVFLENVDSSQPEYLLSKNATIDFANAHSWPFLDHEIRFSRSYQRGSRTGSPIFDTRYARWYVAAEFSRLADDVLGRMGL